MTRIVPSDGPASLVLDFGSPDWQAHLGGSFYGPEVCGGISYNWAGAGRCWAVLAGLDAACDYAVSLEAAPFALYGAELQQVSLVAPDGRLVLEHVFPADADGAARPLRLPASAAALHVEFRWRRLGAPALAVSVNAALIARLPFAPRPELQTADFLLRRDFLQNNTVLTFEPDYAVVPQGGAEKRALSFRFFRLSLWRLP